MKIAALLASLSSILISAPVAARDGNYIAPWAENGRLVIHDSNLLFLQSPIAHVDASGAMLSAGICEDQSGSSRNICIIRYLKDAERDKDFGASGVVRLIASSTASRVSTLTTGTDGMIYLTANIPTADDNRLVAYRIWPNGFHNFSTDRFGFHFVSDASVVYPESYASAIAVTSDHRLVVAGRGKLANHSYTVAFARLRLSFVYPPDSTFGNFGVALVSEVETGSSFPKGILDIHLYDDGRIAAVGGAGESSGMQPYLLRLNSDGSLDQAFAKNGIALHPKQSWNNLYNALTRDAEDRLVVAGSFSQDYAFDAYSRIARFTDAGLPDLTFGVDGELIFSGGEVSPPSEGGSLVSIQPDEKIVMVGYAQGVGDSSDIQVVVTRHHSDGQPDSSFGIGGRVLREFRDSDGPGLLFYMPQIATSMRVLHDSMIIGGGFGLNADRQVQAFMKLNNDTIFDERFD